MFVTYIGILTRQNKLVLVVRGNAGCTYLFWKNSSLLLSFAGSKRIVHVIVCHVSFFPMKNQSRLSARAEYRYCSRGEAHAIRIGKKITNVLVVYDDYIMEGKIARDVRENAAQTVTTRILIPFRDVSCGR